MIDTNKYPLLFSVGTNLAYSVDNEYYHGVHHVWCATKIDSFNQPLTSNPISIAKRWLRIVADGDIHVPDINANVAGIMNGAKKKLNKNLITKKDNKAIRAKVAVATYKDFLPVLYVIDSEKVKNRCQEVPPKKVASSTSIEYIIDDLQDGEYDLLDIGDLAREIRQFSNRRLR